MAGNTGGLPGLSGSLRVMSHFQFEPSGMTAFFGGWSSDKKLGTKAPQFEYSQHFDFRKNPSQLTVLPQGQPASSATINDLVLDMAQINTGVRYAVGSAGSVYKVGTNGSWELYGNLDGNSGAGITYRSDVDHTYIPSQTSIARIKRTQQSPSWQSAWFERGMSTASTCYKVGGSNTFQPPTSVTENSTRSRKFTTDIEPLYQIGIKVISKGTGDWTLYLHNDANDLLGSATITNSNLVENTVNYFVFSSPLRAQRGDNGAGAALTYHFHVNSTVADGTLATTTKDSIADCDMELWATALVPTNNGLHPATNFLNYTLIGNGQYVAQYEPLQDSPAMSVDYLPHRITLPPGFEVCGFAQKNLLCVVGAEKRSTSGEFQEGALFFWDGISDTYNDWWPVPEGSPESLYSQENVVRYIAGGSLYEIQGTDQPVKIRTLRNTDSTYSSIADTTHCYPNMMAVRRGVLLMGYPSYTTNTALEHAVYSYGRVSNEYPISFGLNYTLSTGTLLNNGSNNLKIGMVKSFGDTSYISWRDDSSSPHKYGVDVVDNTSSPAATASIESLEYDFGRPAYYKKAGFIVATTNTLPSDASYKLKYRLDGETSWHYSENAAAGSTYLVFPVDLRYLRAQFGLDLSCGATTPVIQSLQMFSDMQVLERPIGGGV